MISLAGMLEEIYAQEDQNRFSWFIDEGRKRSAENKKNGNGICLKHRIGFFSWVLDYEAGRKEFFQSFISTGDWGLPFSNIQFCYTHISRPWFDARTLGLCYLNLLKLIVMN